MSPGRSTIASWPWRRSLSRRHATLTLALLGRDDAVSLAQAHMVARESRGNPLFIDELVKHIQSGEPTERWEDIGQLDLDEVLWARTQRQPEDSQRLLGVVAVSGRPIRQALAFQATELVAGARVALASLRSARLIRCIGSEPARRDRNVPRSDPRDGRRSSFAGPVALVSRAPGAGLGDLRAGGSRDSCGALPRGRRFRASL